MFSVVVCIRMGLYITQSVSGTNLIGKQSSNVVENIKRPGIRGVQHANSNGYPIAPPTGSITVVKRHFAASNKF